MVSDSESHSISSASPDTWLLNAPCMCVCNTCGCFYPHLFYLSFSSCTLRAAQVYCSHISLLTLRLALFSSGVAFMTHISTFKTLHLSWAGVHHVRAVTVLHSVGHLQCLCERVQEHEHLPPKRLDMFQFGVLTPQTHCFKLAGKLPESPQLILQQLVRNEWRDTGYGDSQWGSGQRGHLHKQVSDKHSALHQLMNKWLVINEHNHRLVHPRCKAELVMSHQQPAEPPPHLEEKKGEQSRGDTHKKIVLRSMKQDTCPQFPQPECGGRSIHILYFNWKFY